MPPARSGTHLSQSAKDPLPAGGGKVSFSPISSIRDSQQMQPHPLMTGRHRLRPEPFDMSRCKLSRTASLRGTCGVNPLQSNALWRDQSSFGLFSAPCPEDTSQLNTKQNTDICVQQVNSSPHNVLLVFSKLSSGPSYPHTSHSPLLQNPSLNIYIKPDHIYPTAVLCRDSRGPRKSFKFFCIPEVSRPEISPCLRITSLPHPVDDELQNYCPFYHQSQ